MIRAIISDVDGVLIGTTPGVNFPYPQEDVVEKIQHIREKGISFILCTAKSLHPNIPIIQKAHLDNFHIADGGSIIANPLLGKQTTYTIPKDIIEKIVYFVLENNIYIELYTAESYFIQQDQVSSFTRGHKEILQQDPIIVHSLLEVISEEEIIKIMLIVPSIADKGIVEPLFEGLAKDISTYWAIHPTMLPAQFGVITRHGVSKKHAAEEIIKNLGISFDNVLGIGDSKGDWSFLKLCKYVGVIGENKELITLVKEKGEGNYFIAPSVEENGIVKVFEHFSL